MKFRLFAVQKIHLSRNFLALKYAECNLKEIFAATDNSAVLENITLKCLISSSNARYVHLR